MSASEPSEQQRNELIGLANQVRELDDNLKNLVTDSYNEYLNVAQSADSTWETISRATKQIRGTLKSLETHGNDFLKFSDFVRGKCGSTQTTPGLEELCTVMQLQDNILFPIYVKTQEVRLTKTDDRRLCAYQKYFTNLKKFEDDLKLEEISLIDDDEKSGSITSKRTENSTDYDLSVGSDPPKQKVSSKKPDMYRITAVALINVGLLTQSALLIDTHRHLAISGILTAIVAFVITGISSQKRNNALLDVAIVGGALKFLGLATVLPDTSKMAIVSVFAAVVYLFTWSWVTSTWETTPLPTSVAVLVVHVWLLIQSAWMVHTRPSKRVYLMAISGIVIALFGFPLAYLSYKYPTKFLRTQDPNSISIAVISIGIALGASVVQSIADHSDAVSWVSIGLFTVASFVYTVRGQKFNRS